eukprot:TRINITY_DN2133_c0_g1_i11.p1 TRINITY_DN2133_c0_g1~~TRINITY_DN2133_c0_g1_i11.p1  ORF type:complete len:511 (+),score=139.52 TRINITY_DN2133_c0_g1_i11:1767-3299(+)
MNQLAEHVDKFTQQVLRHLDVNIPKETLKTVWQHLMMSEPLPRCLVSVAETPMCHFHMLLEMICDNLQSKSWLFVGLPARFNTEPAESAKTSLLQNCETMMTAQLEQKNKFLLQVQSVCRILSRDVILKQDNHTIPLSGFFDDFSDPNAPGVTKEEVLSIVGKFSLGNYSYFMRAMHRISGELLLSIYEAEELSSKKSDKEYHEPIPEMYPVEPPPKIEEPSPKEAQPQSTTEEISYETPPLVQEATETTTKSHFNITTPLAVPKSLPSPSEPTPPPETHPPTPPSQTRLPTPQTHPTPPEPTPAVPALLLPETQTFNSISATFHDLRTQMQVLVKHYGLEAELSDLVSSEQRNQYIFFATLTKLHGAKPPGDCDGMLGTLSDCIDNEEVFVTEARVLKDKMQQQKNVKALPPPERAAAAPPQPCPSVFLSSKNMPGITKTCQQQPPPPTPPPPPPPQPLVAQPQQLQAYPQQQGGAYPLQPPPGAPYYTQQLLPAPPPLDNTQTAPPHQ